MNKAIENIRAQALEAVDAAARNVNGSRDWHLARFWALEYVLDQLGANS